MVSHKKLSGMELTLGKGGLRFKKRASGYNACIGSALKGGEGPTHGGRYDKSWQSKFTAAAKSCAGRKLRRAM
jgi:hypothetical protein